MHIFRFPPVGHKGDDAPVAVSGDGEPRLLVDLPQGALLGAFAVQELAADADPLVAVAVVFLFHPVEHQILPGGVFQIAKGGIAHTSASFGPLL